MQKEESIISVLSLVYCITTACSLLLLIGYLAFVQKKEPWFYLLFASVLIVNIGYFAFSLSKTLEEALLANRISYFGSVFLPMAMLMIVVNLTELSIRKWVPPLLLAVGVVVFLIAASPGYLDIYYKDVEFVVEGGINMLKKVYGPWHVLYPIYLLGYFASMIAVSIYAFVRKKLVWAVHCVFLIVAVFTNLCVWLLEQFVKFEFEFLSVSYIISELFLLSLYLLLEHESNLNRADKPIESAVKKQTKLQKEFIKKVQTLTKTEKTIYDLYVDDKTTKEILAELNITDNTLKFHNKNIYSKLGVQSRKQLKEIAKTL